MSRPDEGPRGIRRGRAGLGTFGGVFTPSVLTILGLILFLRLGFVVGNAGLVRTLGIFALATSISLLTSSSLSAIATNRRVRSGGDYYLISRSLGIAYGGALGLLLFVAQAVSVGFYCLGLGEGLASVFPAAPDRFATNAATVAAALLLGVAWLGADLATRMQYGIMAILGLALASFFIGGVGSASAVRLGQSLAPHPGGPGFWLLFAVFFPAVTGFTQGVSMSGDLADARESLPRGTFLAVFVSSVVYLAAIVVLAAAVPRETLVGDYASMRTVALVPGLIDAGVIAATASSALSSLLGAPRILQALAADGVFPWLAFAARTHGPSRNPRRAVLLTAAIAFATIQARSLNAVAALVSMFFLVSYGLLNYATWVEATARSPSFRPRFTFFHRRASLLGTLLAVAAMIAIDPRAALVAGAIMTAIYQYVQRTAVPARWRDSRRAYQFHRIKQALREVADEPDDPRDWQPHLLAFTAGEERRERLLRFGSWITGGTGIVTAVQLVPGDAAAETSREARLAAEGELREEIARHGLDAFPLAIAAGDLRVGAGVLVQAWGVGPIRSNTVLLNWLDRDPVDERSAAAELWFGRLLRTAIRLGRSVVVLDAETEDWRRLLDTAGEERRIDVWWGGDASTKLALLLAYLMTRTEDWRDARIRLVVPAAQNPDSARANLEGRLEEMRIEASVRMLGEATPAALVEAARDATLVLLPLRVHGMRVVDPFDGPLAALLERLPATALVAAASDVELVDGEAEQPVAPAAPDREPAGET